MQDCGWDREQVMWMADPCVFLSCSSLYLMRHGCLRPGNALPLPPEWGITDSCHASLAFMWVLGIWISVLYYMARALYTESPPQPCVYTFETGFGIQ